MKTNNSKKIVVSVLALAMGAGVAGSISGSMAWYQYSTRAAASFAGTSAGTTRNLQISDDAGASWGQHVDLGSETFRPASVYGTAGSLSFVDHPVYQYPTLPAATVVAGSVYMKEFNLVFKLEDSTDGTTQTQVEKPIYLSQLSINYTGTGHDITPAVRMEIKGENNSFIIAKTAGTTNTSGKLDLNKNTKDDRDYYDTLDTQGTEITYKNAATGGESYTSVATTSVVVNTTDPYAFASPDESALSTKALTTTKASGASATVRVRVWIEGWQPLDEKTIWDAGYIAQNFNIQMQFACEANR